MPPLLLLLVLLVVVLLLLPPVLVLLLWGLEDEDGELSSLALSVNEALFVLLRFLLLLRLLASLSSSSESSGSMSTISAMFACASSCLARSTAAAVRALLDPGVEAALIKCSGTPSGGCHCDCRVALL